MTYDEFGNPQYQMGTNGVMQYLDQLPTSTRFGGDLTGDANVRLNSLGSKYGIGQSDWLNALNSAIMNSPHQMQDLDNWGSEMYLKNILTSFKNGGDPRGTQAYNDYFGTYNPAAEQSQQATVKSANDAEAASHHSTGLGELGPLLTIAALATGGAGLAGLFSGSGAALGSGGLYSQLGLDSLGAWGGAEAAGSALGAGSLTTGLENGAGAISSGGGSFTPSFDYNSLSTLNGTPFTTPSIDTGIGFGSGSGGINGIGEAAVGNIMNGGAYAGATNSMLSQLGKFLTSPVSGSGGIGSSTPLGMLGSALGQYLSGSNTADKFSNLSNQLLQAGDITQRPGNIYMLGQLQKYMNPSEYINGIAQPIMNSYAQKLPAAIAKTGDLTNSMNKSMTDMSSAISQNYNGFLGNLIQGSGLSQGNTAVGAAGQAAGTGINTGASAQGALFGTLGNIASNAAGNIFGNNSNNSGSNTNPVSNVATMWG